MSTVRVTLPRYNQSWDLSRDQILAIIPESLVGQALQEEPDVPEITLDYPDVTPEAMNVIAEILQGREPQHHVPNLSSSARYLNLPWLIYYEDPLYDQVERPTYPGGSYDTSKNRELLLNAIETGHNVAMGYLLLKGVSPLKETILAYQNPQGWPPAWPTSPALEEAMRVDNVEAFRILMSDPRVAKIYSLLGLFQSRYLGRDTAITRYLLQVIPKEEFIGDEWVWVNSSSLVDDLEFTQLIYPLLTTQKQRDTLINAAIENNKYDVFSWLIDQPGNTNYRAYLESAVEWSQYQDVFHELLSHLPNLTREDYNQLLEQAEYSSSDIVKDVLTGWMQELGF
jgi:hypothetical protein